MSDLTPGSPFPSDKPNPNLENFVEYGHLDLPKLTEYALSGEPGDTKIKAIKIFREATGLGLKAAKDIIEYLMASTDNTNPIRTQVQAQQVEIHRNALLKRLEQAQTTIDNQSLSLEAAREQVFQVQTKIAHLQNRYAALLRAHSEIIQMELDNA